MERRGFLGLLAKGMLAFAYMPSPAPAPSPLLAQRVVVNMRDMIVMYQPTANPLIMLTTATIAKRRCLVSYDWLEKKTWPR